MSTNEIKRTHRAPACLARPGKAREQNPADFGHALAESETAVRERRIEALLEAIAMQGCIVALKKDLREYQQYRALVTDLLRETVRGCFIFSHSGAADTQGLDRSHSIVRIVNQRLDDMAAEVFKEQSNNLALIAMVEEIRGLLLDICS
jgi:uncharacterized protein